MTIGPSMANLVQFYGRRQAYGLSVSPNPLNRNPSYEPLAEPRPGAARQRDPVRRLGRVLGLPLAQVLAAACCGYAERYDGRAVHVELLPSRRPPAAPRRAAGDRRLRGAPVTAPAPRRGVCAAHLAGSRPAAAAQRPATPIEHFVVLMQENHSFDNYFGTFPGADGIPRGTCMPIRRRAPGALRAAVPARRPRGSGPSPRRRHAPDPVLARRDGRLRPRRLAPAARRPELSVMGLLRRARPAVLLERRRGVRPVRPLLRGGAGRQRGQPSVLGHGHGWWYGGGIPDRASAASLRSSTASRSAGSRGSSTFRTTTRATDRGRGDGRPQRTGGTRSALELPALCA